MFPLACFNLRQPSWIWFMMQLKRCIGPVSPLAVHIGACKGLENAVKNVFSHFKHMECFGHIWMNVIRKFKGDDYGRLWPAAISYTQQTHSYNFGKIMVADCGFAPWMNQYHSLLWYR
jgi:hypothetical protein